MVIKRSLSAPLDGALIQIVNISYRAKPHRNPSESGPGSGERLRHGMFYESTRGRGAAELLAKIEFLTGLDRITHAKLAAHLQSVPLKSGEVPFREGEPGFPAKSRGFRRSSEGYPNVCGDPVFGELARVDSRIL